MNWAFAPETVIDWVRAACFWVQLALLIWLLCSGGWLLRRGQTQMHTMSLTNADIRKVRAFAALVIFVEMIAIVAIAADWDMPVDLMLWLGTLALAWYQLRVWQRTRPEVKIARLRGFALRPLGLGAAVGVGIAAPILLHAAPDIVRVGRAVAHVEETVFSAGAHAGPGNLTRAEFRSEKAWGLSVPVCIGGPGSLCLDFIGQNEAAINAAKGALGEGLTSARALGLSNRYGKPEVFHVKLRGGTGLDHVVVVRDRDDVNRIVRVHLIETKTTMKAPFLSNARGGKQLSDPWLDDVLREMDTFGDDKVKAAAALIRDARTHSPWKIHREIWWQDLGSGVARRRTVDADGRPQRAWEEVGRPEYSREKLAALCEAKNGAWIAGAGVRAEIRCQAGWQRFVDMTGTSR